MHAELTNAIALVTGAPDGRAGETFNSLDQRRLVRIQSAEVDPGDSRGGTTRGTSGATPAEARARQ